MELRVHETHGLANQGFGRWLLLRIKVKLLSNIKNYNFINWDNYLNTTDTLNKLYERSYTTSDIIRFAANNLVCKGSDKEICIQFDNTRLVPGFDRLRLDVILKTINYGTLDVKGCPIFSDTLNSFANDIETYIRLYYNL